MSHQDNRGYCLYCGLLRGRADGCVYCGPQAAGLTVAVHSGWLPPGTVLRDTYMLGRVLGHGGFGITYLAVDVNLQTRMAVKEYLPRGLATRGHDGATVHPFPDMTEVYAHGKSRFLDEARILARFVDHPNVVSVLTYFEQCGTAYLVMRYLEGMTLAEYRTQKGALQIEEAVGFVLDLLKGLYDIHKAGLLHRDIKPQNIYLTSDGQIKLLDFGSARYALVEKSRTLTTILTPGYAPPEMYFQGGEVGEWTDLYGVGATLYHLLTGVDPQDAFTRIGEDLMKPLSELTPQATPLLSDVIAKACALDSRNRFRNAQELSAALKPFSHQGRTRTSRPTLKRWVAVSDSSSMSKAQEAVAASPSPSPALDVLPAAAITPASISSATGSASPAPAPSAVEHGTGPAPSSVSSPLVSGQKITRRTEPVERSRGVLRVLVPLILSLLGLVSLVAGVGFFFLNWSLKGKKGRAGRHDPQAEKACKAMVRKNQECFAYMKGLMASFQYQREITKIEMPLTLRAAFSGSRSWIMLEEEDRPDFFGGEFVSNCLSDWRSSVPKTRWAIRTWGRCASTSACSEYVNCFYGLIRSYLDHMKGAKLGVPSRDDLEPFKVPECDRLYQFITCMIRKVTDDADKYKLILESTVYAYQSSILVAKGMQAMDVVKKSCLAQHKEIVKEAGKKADPCLLFAPSAP